MAKVLVSLDDALLARVDRAARAEGLTRSTYLARLAAGELERAEGPGRDPKVRRALARLDRLFARNPRSVPAEEALRAARDRR